MIISELKEAIDNLLLVMDEITDDDIQDAVDSGIVGTSDISAVWHAQGVLNRIFSETEG